MEVHSEQLHIHTAPNQQNTLTLFANRGRGSFIDGFVAEMIGIQKAVTPTERKRIEGHLAHKWGLTDFFPLPTRSLIYQLEKLSFSLQLKCNLQNSIMQWIFLQTF